MTTQIEMPEHLQRMIVEKKELKARLVKLIEFLDKGQPEFIDDTQWRLLDDQYEHMKAYHSVLSQRITDAIDNL
ncbi:crAss001_48 related protein [Psychrobacter pygoscelis]|uniref:crAss001_48 related protein n=1 Tax=Psychrobacter pygoscelis TaxID=2488563 RepID=UPI00103A3192|nr:hypothetical protein [Psychrobacter pygoscelis]